MKFYPSIYFWHFVIGARHFDTYYSAYSLDLLAFWRQGLITIWNWIDWLIAWTWDIKIIIWGRLSFNLYQNKYMELFEFAKVESCINYVLIIKCSPKTCFHITGKILMEWNDYLDELYLLHQIFVSPNYQNHATYTIEKRWLKARIQTTNICTR